jgi:flagellar P-ring protein FlgI
LMAALATARDAAAVDVILPPQAAGQVVEFIAKLEAVTVQPDRRARVVINERTGTVVAGQDVTIAPVAISQGDLKLTIVRRNAVLPGGWQQPQLVLSDTEVGVAEREGAAYVAAAGTVAELMQALAKMKTPTRDAISILRAIKAAGALHADLIVQ